MASTLLTRSDGLRDLRSRRGITQQRLAELAGCSLSMVRVLEGGLLPKRSDVLGRIVSVLNDEEIAAKRSPVPTSTAGVGSDGSLRTG
jgi:predicted transcriptional regulator